MNLPELLDNRSEIRLRPVREREKAIITYRVILNTLIREIKTEYKATVLPLFKANREYRADAEGWFSSLKSAASRAVARAVEKMKSLLFGEAASYVKRFWKSLFSGTKIDIPIALLGNPAKELSIIEDYVQKNASLIKSLSDDVITRIERTVYDAKLNNHSASQLSKELQKQFGITSKRANLIAVDQMASLNADLTQMHHQSLGIKSYVWRDRADGRVRDLHKKLRGKVYEWGKPTDAEDGLPPGKPIRCRCTAIAVLPARQQGKRVPASGVIEQSEVVNLIAGQRQ